jgi:hypothetical protein
MGSECYTHIGRRGWPKPPLGQMGVAHLWGGFGHPKWFLEVAETTPWPRGGSTTFILAVEAAETNPSLWTTLETHTYILFFFASAYSSGPPLGHGWFVHFNFFWDNFTNPSNFSHFCKQSFNIQKLSLTPLKL